LALLTFSILHLQNCSLVIKIVYEAKAKTFFSRTRPSTWKFFNWPTSRPTESVTITS